MADCYTDLHGGKWSMTWDQFLWTIQPVKNNILNKNKCQQHALVKYHNQKQDAFESV